MDPESPLAQWLQRRLRMPNKSATDAAAAVDKLAESNRAIREFAINLIDLALVRLEELASRPTVDTTELQSVVDELNVGRRELAVKISRL
jgi:hypothetical protein